MAIPAFTKRSSGGLRRSIVANGPLSGAFFGSPPIPVRGRTGEPQMKGWWQAQKRRRKNNLNKVPRFSEGEFPNHPRHWRAGLAGFSALVFA
jgi:hypothetical protein